MYVYDFMLEVTRRCNLKCEHCLRGCAQRLDMSREVITSALRSVDRIGCLTITGGEPSLKPEIIEDIIQTLVWHKTEIYSFYVVTNAVSTRNRIRFLEALDRLIQFCDEPDACSLQYSGDQYHRYVRGNPNLKHFEGYYVEQFGERYYKEVEFFHGSKSDYIREPLNEGNAAKNGVGNHDPEQQKPWEVSEYYGEFQVNEGHVYISANGNIVSNCNMSYERIDQEAKGNILKDNLEDVIRSFCIYEEEEDDAYSETA